MPTLADSIKTLTEQGSLEGLQALAAKFGASEVVSDRDPKFKRQAAHWAARNNRPEILDWLASNGADLNAGDENDATPVLVAAMNGASEAVAKLVALGANVEKPVRDGRTPYMFAMSQAHKGQNFARSAKLLLDAGANPDAVDAEGKGLADHVQDLAKSKLSAERAEAAKINEATVRAQAGHLLGDLDGVNKEVASAFGPEGDPMAAHPPAGPKTAVSQDAAGAPNVGMGREEALKKLADLGFETLGGKEGAPRTKGREAESAEISTLLGKGKNVLMVGRVGVGKRSLAKACAESLAERGKIVMRVPSAVFRGNKYAGSVNENIQKWLGAALSLGDELVLFINDAHQLATGKTSSDTTDTPIQILREQMDRNKEKSLTLLCATTPSESKALAEDESFLSMFTRKDVAGMDKEQALQALLSPAGSAQLLREHPDADMVAYKALCERAASLCDKYLFNQSFPGKAFQFVGAALAQRAPKDCSPAVIDELFRKTYSVPKEIVEGRMASDSPFYQIKDALMKKVIGQDGPIADISNALCSQVTLANPNSHKPVTMLFAGPTGVGKTEAAETIAKTLGLPALLLSMGEFTSPGSAEQLRAKIAAFAIANYAGVILVDEIEKSHPVVRDVLLNPFDKGVVGSGDEAVSFGFMVMIATTNVGAKQAVAIKQRLRQEFGDPKIHESWTRDQLINAGFRPEFVNRIDLACDFNDITPKDAMTIAINMFADKAADLLKSRGIILAIDPGIAKSHAADVFNADFGARGIRRCVDQTLQSIVGESSLALAIGPGSILSATAAKGGGIQAKVVDVLGKVVEAVVGAKNERVELARLQAILGAPASGAASPGAPAPKASELSDLAAENSDLKIQLRGFAQLVDLAFESSSGPALAEAMGMAGKGAKPA